MPSLYRVLGVKKTATPEEMKAAYRKKSLKHHPDRNPGDETAAERFRGVQLAYDVLSDPGRRARYDATGEVGADPKVDHSLSHVAEVIAPVLQSAVVHLVKQNQKATGHDLVKMVRDGLGQTRANLHSQLQAEKRAAEFLAAAVGRFEQTGEVNLLAGIATQQLAAVRAGVAKLTELLDRHDKAIEYMKKLKYRHKAQQQFVTYFQLA